MGPLVIKFKCVEIHSKVFLSFKWQVVDSITHCVFRPVCLLVDVGMKFLLLSTGRTTSGVGDRIGVDRGFSIPKFLIMIEHIWGNSTPMPKM